MGRRKYHFTEAQINELRITLKRKKHKKIFRTIQSFLLRAEGYPVSEIIIITSLS